MSPAFLTVLGFDLSLTYPYLLNILATNTELILIL